MKFGLAQAGMRMVLVSLPCSTPSRRCFADDQAHPSTQLVRGWILPVFTGYNTLGGGHGVNGEKKRYTRPSHRHGPLGRNRKNRFERHTEIERTEEGSADHDITTDMRRGLRGCKRRETSEGQL